MKKPVLIVIPVILAVAAGLYFLVNRGEEDFGNLIKVSGNIELTEVGIAFKVSGRLIERTVDEGETVKKGALVARLDRDQLTAQKNRETAGLQFAIAQLAQAETALEWQKQSLEADIEQRRADLAATEARLLELKNGSRPEEIKEAEATVAAAQAEYTRTGNDWKRAQALHKSGDISMALYDQYRSQWERAEAVLKQAKERQTLVLAGPRREQIEAASAQVDRARAAINAAEANRLEIKRREQELPLRRADIARAEANLTLIETQLADTEVYSPIDGVVLVKAAEPGEILPAGTPVVTIGDLDHPWLRAYIRQTDQGKVKLGDKVKITTDSYPDKIYEGRVSFIASEAEFTPKQIQTQEERVKLVYRIKIDVENPEHELKSNMPADAVIELK
jgi:HlyD family secretion protein